MNVIRNTARFAMSIVADYVKPGDHVVDATFGNGHDTLELSRLVGEEGKVYGFEIQPLAVLRGMNMLYEEGAEAEIEVAYQGHENMDLYISEEVSAVVFNLGYLPGGEDKEITTRTETTLIALEKALGLLKVDGILSVTMYCGHEEGKREKREVLSWAEKLDKSIYHAAYIAMVNQPETAPEILLVTKKK